MVAIRSGRNEDNKVEIGRRLTHPAVVATPVVMVAAGSAAFSADLAPAAIGALVVSLGALMIALTVATATARTTEPQAAEGPDLLYTLNRELERSRRLEQPLSVARLPLVEGGPVGTAGVYLARSVQASLRTIDETIADGDSIYLVLPGTDRVHAQACVQRVAEARPGLFVDADIRFGTFPEDGVTIAGILQVLDGAPPAAAPDDLPRIDRRRRITVDLTAKTPVSTEVDA